MKKLSLTLSILLLPILLLWGRSFVIFDQISIGNYFEGSDFVIIYEKREKGFPTWPPRTPIGSAYTLFSFKGIINIREEVLYPQKNNEQSMSGYRSDNKQFATFSNTKTITYSGGNGGEWHIHGVTLPFWSVAIAAGIIAFSFFGVFLTLNWFNKLRSQLLKGVF